MRLLHVAYDTKRRISIDKFGYSEDKVLSLLTIFQTYLDLKAEDTQSIAFKWQDRNSNPCPLDQQANSLKTRPLPLTQCKFQYDTRFKRFEAISKMIFFLRVHIT